MYPLAPSPLPALFIFDSSIAITPDKLCNTHRSSSTCHIYLLGCDVGWCGVGVANLFRRERDTVGPDIAINQWGVASRGLIGSGLPIGV